LDVWEWSAGGTIVASQEDSSRYFGSAAAVDLVENDCAALEISPEPDHEHLFYLSPADCQLPHQVICSRPHIPSESYSDAKSDQL